MKGTDEQQQLQLLEQQQLQRSFSPLQTLTSGLKREVKGGAIQAHTCVVASVEDVNEVITALRDADGFQNVASWSYAYRIVEQGGQHLREATEDGLDEGCGEKVLGVLQRHTLQGLLLIVGRWQDYGATPGLEVFGTSLYSVVVERCKDLITNLKKAMGLGATSAAAPEARRPVTGPPPGPKTFSFNHLPALREPRVQPKYGPNHFLSETSLNRPASLPNLLSGGGDPRLWMANSQSLSNLPDTDLWALRSIRQPDWRIEEVLRAVAILRGQVIKATGTAAARWGQCKEILKSPTLRAELQLFDANQVPVDSAEMALHLLEGLDAEDIRRASPGAAALFEWARGVALWRLQGPSAAFSQQSQSSFASLGPAPSSHVHLPAAHKKAGGLAEAPALQRSRSVASSISSPTNQPRCGGFGISAPRKRPGGRLGAALTR